MLYTKLIMGMPVTIEMIDPVTQEAFDEVFSYFKYIDQKFSTYKKNSEISKINDGRLKISESSEDMKTVFKLAEKTKKETNGYFNIYHDGKYDPSGIVKGWAIFEAFKILKKIGIKDFYINVGDDIQIEGRQWVIGIKNPFKQNEIIKVIKVKDKGVATSGDYIRGNHIYNPKGKNQDEIVSLTVIGPNIYEADRFATGAFAMGRKGINFIDSLRCLPAGRQGFEGYMIDKKGIATMTSGFKKYT